MTDEWALFWVLSAIYGTGAAFCCWICYRLGELHGEQRTRESIAEGMIRTGVRFTEPGRDPNRENV